jgi:hypothetical protein
MSETPVVNVIYRLLCAAILLFILCGGYVGWIVWNFDRPPFDLTLLERLEPGISKTEVQQILGSPGEDYGSEWAYWRAGSWPTVYVYFDELGHFTKSEYDY